MAEQYLVIRKEWAESDARRDAGLTTPPEIERFDNISYGPDEQWHRLDVYRPRSAAGRLPVIVSFHGGAWVYGSKEVYQFYCMDLARRGFAVVNYSYRLAPEHRFPAAMEDTNSVFAWTLAHAEEFGFDPEAVFAVGDSAGAMGIALYACALTNPDYAACFPFRVPAGLRLRGLALNCGIYAAHGRAAELADYLPVQDAGRALRMLHVPDHVTADFPPSYVMTANRDFLHAEPDCLLKVFDRLGVPYRYRMYGDAEHPLAHVFHCNIRTEAAQQANDDECAFFRSRL
ncbi:MAG: alpha/beta hydrolase [Oscillospiraceae bacterium]|nr:alpha/beta hydrolase [Oscillospiraceae bacterium]